MKFLKQWFKRDDLQTYIKQGDERTQNGDYAQALAAYDQALRLAKNVEQEATIYILRCAAHYGLNQHKAAVQDATRAIELGHGDLAMAYRHRAVSLLHLGQLEQAIADATEALMHDPQYALPYYVRGVCFYSQHNYEAAARDLGYYTELATKKGGVNPKTIRQASQMFDDCLAQLNLPKESAPLQRAMQLGEVLASPEFEVQKLSQPPQWREFEVGDLIKDRYKVRQVLEGGMGIVYIADDLLKGHRYAIKTFRSRFLQHRYEITRARFEEEARTWIALDKHPNIVQAKWFAEYNGVPYIFMEYVDGMSLRGWLVQNRSRPLEQVLDFVLQMCDGMAYVWDKQRIVHRDLKPDNVMISRDGAIKVTDFGLAKALDGIPPEDANTLDLVALRSGILLTQEGVGTLPYMAPEQFEDARNVGVSADIYAFGIILYEMLAGHWPFNGQTPQEFRQHHRQTPPPLLKSLISSITPQLNDIILRCLAKTPDERYQNFREPQQELLPLYEIVAGKAFQSRGEREPLTPAGWTDKGSYLCALKNYEQGLACFDRALELDPSFVLAYANKGMALQRMDRRQEAIECYETALSYKPDFPFVRSNLGDSLADSGRFQESLETYEVLIQTWAQSPLGWQGKARALRGLGRFQEAIECYDQALARQDGPIPEEVDREGYVAMIWYNRGNCYRSIDNQPEAIYSYDQTLAINPHQAGAWLNKGNSLINLERFEEAILACDQAIALYPNYEKAWFSKGQALEHMDRPDEAMVCYDRVLALNPTFVAAHLCKGLYLYHTGEYHHALSAFGQALQHEPDNTLAREGQAACLEALGREEEAQASRHRVMEQQAPVGADPGQVVLVTPDTNPDLLAFLASISGVPACHSCHKQLPTKAPRETIMLKNKLDQEEYGEMSVTMPFVCLPCQLVVCSKCAHKAAKARGAKELRCPNCYGPVTS